YDHLLFLFSLLLVVRTWKDIVKIVSTFTVAHTITLILAALQVVHLPSWLVEVSIALSICYVAAENLLKKQFNKRWLLTFALGLIHGFGFAGVLAEMSLPKTHMLTGLVTFNLGVEAGQLGVVIVLLPFLLWMRKAKWHPRFLQVGSVLIFLLGLTWAVQRFLTM
ncbi:MAG TPA: HupE/UreJ family protein, partial [Bacilli bacterium]|nr:HupE/UreJ family protein [Bacilli bacterium]